MTHDIDDDSRPLIRINIDTDAKVMNKSLDISFAEGPVKVHNWPRETITLGEIPRFIFILDHYPLDMLIVVM